jgi:hypothetical protein
MAYWLIAPIVHAICEPTSCAYDKNKSDSRVVVALVVVYARPI